MSSKKRFSKKAGKDKMQDRRIKKLEKVVNAREKKYEDHVITDANINSTGTTSQLVAGITKGDSDGQRTGIKIYVEYIWAKFLFVGNPDDNQPDVIRWMIVLDKQPDGTAMIASELLENVTSSQSVISPLLSSLGGRVRVLAEGCVTLPILGGAGETIRFYTPSIKCVKKYIKVNKEVYYTTNTGGVADVQSNNLFLLMISNVSGSTPQATAHIRVRYSDM